MLPLTSRTRLARIQPSRALPARGDGLPAGPVPEGVARDGQQRSRGRDGVALCAHGGPRQAFPLLFAAPTLILMAPAGVDIDVPIVQTASSGSSGSAAEPTPEQISMLADMGFSPHQARKALRQTVRGLTLTAVFALVLSLIPSSDHRSTPTLAEWRSRARHRVAIFASR
jgi:hypothetical protein